MDRLNVMDRLNILPSIICRRSRPAAAVIAAIQTWLVEQRCRLRGWGRITEGETNIESLPDELLFDILVRLRDHDKAGLVCRRWCHIIRSDAFISTYNQQYSSYGLVLSIPEYSHAIYVTATQGGIETSELSDVCITASYNGMVLVFKDEGKPGSLHVLNPATKQSFLLPSVSTRNRLVYFDMASIAYSAASMEYKVILPYSRVEFGCKQHYLDIVTVGVDESWRHVDISYLQRDIRSVLFYSYLVNSEGFVHWRRGSYLMTLNVETEMITKSEDPPIPPESYSSSYNYLTTGRYITMLVGRGEFLWEVWGMKPESEEWRKVLPNIDLEAIKCWLREKFPFESVEYLNMKPLGWVKYPEILAFCFWRLERTCIFYNRVTHEIKTIELPYKTCSYSMVFPHRNNPVWLSQD